MRGTVSDLIEGDEMGRRPIISGSLPDVYQDQIVVWKEASDI